MLRSIPLLCIYLITVNFLSQLTDSADSYSNCDKKSIGTVVKPGDTFTPKVFLGCAFRFGELSRFTSRRDDGPIEVNCKSGNETLSGKLESGQMFVIDVFKEPLTPLDWKCSFVDVYGEKISVNPFTEYKNKENFNYEITYAGAYDVSPRLLSMWET